MDQHAVRVVVVEGVAGDVLAAIDHEHAQAANARDPLGHDGSGKTGADDEDVGGGHTGSIGA